MEGLQKSGKEVIHELIVVMILSSSSKTKKP